MESLEMYDILRLNKYAGSLRPRFESQPPADLRKSNFFNFRVELRSGDALVDIVHAKFQHFINEDQNGNPHLRNGIKYSIIVKYPNETTERKDLYLMLVDAATQEPVRYEGHDDNPKMQRVLLTHETICTRCSLNKSCGNKNEAPSDPGIASKGILKFFMKCNQNCLKGAGNPRDMRRFALAISFDDMTFDKRNILAMSNQMFVHNNSKHSRKRKKDEALGLDHRGMKVFYVSPSGERIVVVGDHFQTDTRVFIDGQTAMTTFRSEHVLEVWLPPYITAPTCRVTLHNGQQFLEAGTIANPHNAPIPGLVASVSPALGSAHEFDFISSRWANPGISFMCGDIHLSIVTLIPGQTAKVRLPYNLPPGFVSITVLWNTKPHFSFPYKILSRTEMERFADSEGYLCLYRKGPYVVESERNIVICIQEMDSKPFNPAIEWGNYFAAVRYYEGSLSFSSSSPDALQPSETSPTL